MARIKEQALRNYVGDRVSRARQMLGITQVDLANEIGASDKSIYNVEHGKVDVSLLMLMRISLALGVPIEEFAPPIKNQQPPEFLEKL